MHRPDQELFGPNDDLAHDLAAIEASFGALRENELNIDVDRADGQLGVHLRRVNAMFADLEPPFPL